MKTYQNKKTRWFNFCALLPVTIPLILLSCTIKEESASSTHAPYDFYVGTYTGKESQGIYKYRLNGEGIIEAMGLMARSENPSFLAKGMDGKFLITVNEIKDENGVGSIESYQVEKDTLLLLSRSSSGGAHPCHVSLDESGFVLVSNYSGGNVGLAWLNDSGKLSELMDVKQHTGSGTTKRQTGPHAHSALFKPASDTLVAADLGTNEIWIYRINRTLRKFDTSELSRIPMSPGAGPRHFVFHPDHDIIYVVNELDCTVTLIKRSEQGEYKTSESYSTLPANYEEDSFCADIHLSPDGRYLYASNRGHNSIVIFGVDPADGSLEYLGNEPTRGDWPRNFALSPGGDYLLVANQKSNNIISFRRDAKTGMLQFLFEVEAPTPTCILFW